MLLRMIDLLLLHEMTIKLLMIKAMDFSFLFRWLQKFFLFLLGRCSFFRHKNLLIYFYFFRRSTIPLLKINWKLKKRDSFKENTFNFKLLLYRIRMILHTYIISRIEIRMTFKTFVRKIIYQILSLIKIHHVTISH